MTSLGESIYRTLAFFDAQDLPLTLAEVKAYLVAGSHNLPPSPLILRGEDGGRREEEEASQEGLLLSDIEKCLQAELAGKVEHRDGFYFLRGREAIVASRKERYQISLRRFRKARRFLGALAYIPYLRAVALSGSQALLNSRPESDIDLLVLTKPNRIWLARLLVSLYFQIIGQRRHGWKIAGRFCLNHYLAENSSITQDQNLYTAVEYASLMPVVGYEIIKKFWERNGWIKNYLPNFHNPLFIPPLYKGEKERGIRGGKGALLQRFLELILDYTFGPLLNYLAGIYQKRRIKLQEYILVSDEELSFHPGSRGQKVLARFQQNVQASRT